MWLVYLPGTAVRAFRIATVPTPHGAPALTGLPEVADDDRLAVLLADPWTSPLDDVVAAFSRVDGPLPVVGGLVSGGQRAGETRLLLDSSVLDNGAVGVILGAGAPVRAVVSQGCRPIGSAMTVTAAQGNAIISLAGEPAIEKVREVLAELDAEEQALAVRGLHVGIANGRNAGSPDFVVRGILAVDPGSGAIAVGDEVDVGTVVQLHLRDADSADADLRTTVESAQRPGIAGAYVFTCNGRGGAMFTSSDHDAALIREGLGVQAIAGFFAAGEIGPVGGANHLHGFTAVVLVVDDEADPGAVEIDRRATRGEASDAGIDLDAELRELLGR